MPCNKQDVTSQLKEPSKNWERNGTFLTICSRGCRSLPYWMNGDPAPKAVLELLSCKCTRSCKLPGCSCMQNGLKCTDMCRLKECQNRPVEETNLQQVIECVVDDEEEDED